MIRHQAAKYGYLEKRLTFADDTLSEPSIPVTKTADAVGEIVFWPLQEHPPAVCTVVSTPSQSPQSALKLSCAEGSVGSAHRKEPRRSSEFLSSKVVGCRRHMSGSAHPLVVPPTCVGRGMRDADASYASYRPKATGYRKLEAPMLSFASKRSFTSDVMRIPMRDICSVKYALEESMRVAFKEKTEAAQTAIKMP